jgi:hypothetical protein
MYVEFRVKNFRGFQDLTVGSLGRVNLIAGKNNVGKTALLEALWLHHGPFNPELGFRVNRFRGIRELNTDQPLIELFNRLKIDAPIEMFSLSSTGEKSSGRIYLREPSRMPIKSEKDKEFLEPSTASLMSFGKEVVIEYTDELGKSKQSVASFTKDEIRFERQAIKGRSSARFLLAKREMGPDDISGFSDLEIRGLKAKTIELAQLIEQRLKDLTIIVRGGIPSIWGDIGIGTLLPLQVMGDGLGRWLLLVQAIQRSLGGMVLIDEIENGLHYSVMVDIWRNLALLARQYNVQLFATTHSAECVRSAHKAFTDIDRSDFKFHRLEDIKGTIQVVSYDWETLGAALDTHLEFR